MKMSFLSKEKKFKLELDIDLENNIMKYNFYIENKKIFQYLFNINLFFYTDGGYSFEEMNNFTIEYKPSKYIYKFKNLKKNNIKS